MVVVQPQPQRRRSIALLWGVALASLLFVVSSFRVEVPTTPTTTTGLITTERSTEKDQSLEETQQHLTRTKNSVECPCSAFGDCILLASGPAVGLRVRFRKELQPATTMNNESGSGRTVLRLSYTILIDRGASAMDEHEALRLYRDAKRCTRYAESPSWYSSRHTKRLGLPMGDYKANNVELELSPKVLVDVLVVNTNRRGTIRRHLPSSGAPDNLRCTTLWSTSGRSVKHGTTTRRATADTSSKGAEMKASSNRQHHLLVTHKEVSPRSLYHNLIGPHSAFQLDATLQMLREEHPSIVGPNAQTTVYITSGRQEALGWWHLAMPNGTMLVQEAHFQRSSERAKEEGPTAFSRLVDSLRSVHGVVSCDLYLHDDPDDEAARQFTFSSFSLGFLQRHILFWPAFSWWPLIQSLPVIPKFRDDVVGIAFRAYADAFLRALSSSLVFLHRLLNTPRVV